MSVPLYFLPGVTPDELVAGGRVRRTVLERAGVAEAFADVVADTQISYGQPSRGPADKAGVWLAALPSSGAMPRLPGYYPDRQEWQSVGEDEWCAWIGIDPADPPTPAELRRRTTYAGYAMRLVEGVDNFDIPIVRRDDGSTELARNVVFGAGGRVEERIKQEYVALWNDLAEACGWVFGDDDQADAGYKLRRGVELAVRVLGVQYRYDRTIHNRLLWIDSLNWATVLYAAIDVPRAERFAEAAKKNGHPSGPATSNASNGSAAATHATNPVGASSSS